MQGVSQEIKDRFFQDTDETGRFMVVSNVTGVSYFVEPIGDGRGGDWGSYNPSTGNIENKKGFDKFTGSVHLKDSIVTPENGFKNVELLAEGESPMGIIALRDEAYEKAGVRKKPRIQTHGEAGSEIIIEAE